jgi:hypothetical protein
MIFEENDIKNISDLLDSEPQKHESGYTWTVRNEELKDKLIFTLYTNLVNLDGQRDENANLISILTQMGTVELHNCTSYMLFEPDEVIFISTTKDKISSLILGKKGTISLYSNIDKKLIGADFADLDTAYLMSAMQLALTEAII